MSGANWVTRMGRRIQRHAEAEGKEVKLSNARTFVDANPRDPTETYDAYTKRLWELMKGRKQ